jgi:hypothetical protein
MRRIILLISLFLLPAAWAFAQYGPNGGYGERQRERQGERQYDRDQGGNRMKVEGCLFGDPGNLALIDDQGNTFNLSGRTGRLNRLIGHRVRVAGKTWFDADNPNAMAANGEATPTLRVFETEQVYRGRCDQWGGSAGEFRFSIPLH